MKTCSIRLLKFTLTGIVVSVLLVIVNYLVFLGEFHRWKTHPDPSGKIASVNGAKLFYKVKGRGQPLFILESGLGSSYTKWETLQARLALWGTVVIYDRGDYGYSETTNYPRTSVAISQELMDLLKYEKLSGPILFIGHSFGANQIVHDALASLEAVQGLVLIDPGMYNSNETVAHLIDDPLLSKSGKNFLKGLFNHNDIFMMQIPGTLGLVYRLYRIQVNSPDENYPLIMNNSSPRYFKALKSEIENYRDVFTEEEKAKLANMPLKLIIANKEQIRRQLTLQGLSASDAQILSDGYNLAQLEYLSLSSKSQAFEANTGEHDIHLIEPDLILSAVEAIIKQTTP
jgi:pimeloyl-ACP methyl ester carboxylesterase